MANVDSIDRWRGEITARVDALERELGDAVILLKANTAVLTELRLSCVRIEGQVRDMRRDVDGALRQMEKHNEERAVNFQKKITDGRITRREWAVALGLIIVAPILSAVAAVVFGTIH